MDTKQINCLSKSNFKIKKIYAGCFPSNHLPSEKIEGKKLPLLICCNLCSSDESAADANAPCHWIGFYVTKKSITLFDSGGVENWLGNEDVKRFVRRQNKRLIFNEHQYQPLFSDRCGIYILCFFHAMARGVSFHKFSNSFDVEHLSKNDEIVWNSFKNTFLGNKKICKRI